MLAFDYHDSSAERSGTELPNEIFTTDIQGTVTHTNGRMVLLLLHMIPNSQLRTIWQQT